MDEELRASNKRKLKWVISRRDETSLITSLGTVKYYKTLFKNKETNVCEYLLDRIMGLESHVRMTEDAEAKMLEEAVDSSYRKGGMHVSVADSVSKQTVKNKIHELKFPVLPEKVEKQKEVEYLYIDADEDHVSLQYLEQKGDIRKPRSNTSMPKLAYVYEGLEPVAPKSQRMKLIEPKYFGGVYDGSHGVEQFWKEVDSYIQSTYDITKIKKIYINGDGASWIKSGLKWVGNSTFVLDKFHMQKYIVAATSHLGDSSRDARSELYGAIYKKSRKTAKETFEKILYVTEGDNQQKKVETSRTYILGHWDGIMNGIRNNENHFGCSAEGHVSHIYADRMSSRPLGWSKKGVNQMSKLRVFKANKGNMLELVRMQKQELPMAAGAEYEKICLSCDMVKEEGKRLREEQRYLERMTHSIPYPQIKKIAYFRKHIWGL